ncbi:Protein suppressor of forked [Gryllus bimaculatus]|nr:Protein suppressor of forked [Gryllus bimaculatus]
MENGYNREKMAQAYDFALEKIGMDIQSYSIWNDYVNFLKAVEAVGSYAENQKISAVRKVYQRGVVNPMVNIEQLWKDYMSFEQNINPIIAEKMAIERGRDYMNARRVAKEFEAVTRGLNRNSPSVPPTGHPEELKQVDLWKKYIAWEKSNPLRTEDTTLITRRVMFAFEQCLLCLGHHPDVWYEAAQFLEQSSKLLTEKGDVTAAKLFSDEAATVYERATSTLLKKNMLLYFAYADFEEGRLKYEKVHQIYSRFLDIQDIDPTLAFVQYMKFARRAEGIKSARTVFKRAREDPRSRFHVFVAAALMEEIWNRFLEFESNIGDLASIVKVEKRRSAVLGQIKEFEGKETAQLVDRYKFLDLYPCSAGELKAIGYNEVASAVMKTLHHSLPAGILDHDEENTCMPRPDFTQMIPFKPKANSIPGDHPVPGGVFPQPPAAAQLCTLLPPPGCFRGPFVAVDMLIDVFNKIQLPETPPLPVADNGCDTKLFDLAKSVHWIVEEGQEGTLTIPAGMNSLKRRRKVGDRIGDDSEDEELAGAPPVNDIYRARQQKRVK